MRSFVRFLPFILPSLVSGCDTSEPPSLAEIEAVACETASTGTRRAVITSARPEEAPLVKTEEDVLWSLALASAPTGDLQYVRLEVTHAAPEVLFFFAVPMQIEIVDDEGVVQEILDEGPSEACDELREAHVAVLEPGGSTLGLRPREAVEGVEAVFMAK